MRVLIVSHGHPDLSPGGAERAAYSLFQHLKAAPRVTPTFVARAEPKDIGHDGWFGAFRGRKDEFLWSPPPIEWFRCVSQQPDNLLRQVETICARFRPDVVHLHHYYFFGLDVLPMLKKMPGTGVTLTLHEYGLICNHNGQMVKRGSLRLCYASSPAECSNCFPGITSGKFFLREALIKQLVANADAFVAPSAFLRDRYVAWGIAPEKFAVIENTLPPGFSPGPKEPEVSETTARATKIRFGYFGQINMYKGANVLLDALRYLSPEALKRVEIVIFGARLEEQPQEFRESLQAKMSESDAVVSFFGPYRNEDVGILLRRVDWMVIPSIWWENSPLVIQEAKAAGTPILASNIGGMAEKVRNGVDGFHFLAGSAIDCASKMESIVAGSVRLQPSPLNVSQQNTRSIEQHLQVYERSMARQPAR
jgi:glycosyltransferase involved in cell wall biosynthesis